MPIVRVGDTLIASVQESMGDQDALTLQAELSAAIERTDAAGVLLDMSVLEMIDSFLARLLGEIALGARLLGAQTVVVGVQPPVAITLVELGIELKGVHTALDVERGIALLHRLVAAERRTGDRASS